MRTATIQMAAEAVKLSNAICVHMPNVLDYEDTKNYIEHYSKVLEEQLEYLREMAKGWESITDKDYEFVVLKNNPPYLVQMKFDDVNDEIFEKALGRQPTKDEAVLLADKFHMIDDGQAKEIAAFVKSIIGSVETLICQCEYGESRSAGIAAAIRQFLYADSIVFFSDERYYPNKLVYEKVLAALEAERDS